MLRDDGDEMTEIARFDTAPGTVSYTHTHTVEAGMDEYKLSAYVVPAFLDIVPYELSDHSEQVFAVDDPFSLTLRIDTFPIRGGVVTPTLTIEETVGTDIVPIDGAAAAVRTDGGAEVSGVTDADGRFSETVAVPDADVLVMEGEVALPDGGAAALQTQVAFPTTGADEALEPTTLRFGAVNQEGQFLADGPSAFYAFLEVALATA